MRIGCDLVQISRIARLAQNTRFLDRVFHPIELEELNDKAGRNASLAARFAAKEAFSKALGTGIFSEGVVPNEIWIVREPNGRPILHLSPEVHQRLTALGLHGCEVSLSHQGDYALATVLLFPKSQVTPPES